MLNVLRSDFCWPLLFVCFHFSYVFPSLLCVYLGIAWNRRWIMSPRNFRACFLSCIICALLFFTIIFNIKILWMTMALATYATQISNTLTLVVCASVTTLTWIQHVLMVASVLQLTYKQRKDRKELFFALAKLSKFQEDFWRKGAFGMAFRMTFSQSSLNTYLCPTLFAHNLSLSLHLNNL